MKLLKTASAFNAVASEAKSESKEQPGRSKTPALEAYPSLISLAGAVARLIQTQFLRASLLRTFRGLVVLSLFSAACGIEPAYSETVTLRSTNDTTLSELNPNNNFGGYSQIISGSTDNPDGAAFRNRALLRFSLTNQLPTNVFITNVTLTLTVTNVPVGGNSYLFDLRRMKVSWIEGTGTGNNGSPANTGEPTWNNRAAPSTAWPSGWPDNGANTFLGASASKSIGDLGSYTFASTPTLVADVQTWLTNSATNFGWILICQNEGAYDSARGFASREAGTNAAPRLVVQYSTSAPVVPFLMTRVRLTNNSIQFAFTAQVSKPYGVEYRGTMSTSSWTVLSNVPAQPVTTNIVILDPLTPSNRFYRVRTP